MREVVVAPLAMVNRRRALHRERAAAPAVSAVAARVGTTPRTMATRLARRVRLMAAGAAVATGIYGPGIWVGMAAPAENLVVVVQRLSPAAGERAGSSVAVVET